MLSALAYQACGDESINKIVHMGPINLSLRRAYILSVLKWAFSLIASVVKRD